MIASRLLGSMLIGPVPYLLGTENLVITASEFQAILRERPEVFMAVMRGLSHRLRELS